MSYKIQPVWRGFKIDSKSVTDGLDKHQKSITIDENKDLQASIAYTKMVYRLQDTFTIARKVEADLGFGRDYPGTPMEDHRFTLTPDEFSALNKFRDKNPFQRDRSEWVELIQELFVDLAKCHKHTPPVVVHNGVWDGSGGTSFYSTHAVFLTGARSLMTALHEYTHSRGYGEVGAVWWATNAFRIIFPSSYSKLEQSVSSPHLLVTKKTNDRARKRLSPTGKAERLAAQIHEYENKLNELKDKQSRELEKATQKARKKSKKKGKKTIKEVIDESESKTCPVEELLDSDTGSKNKDIMSRIKNALGWEDNMAVRDLD